MQTVFNKAKTKTWIKKAHKRDSFGYGHGYITDGYVMLADEPHMHPTILEVYGTLTPDCRYSPEQFQKMMSLPDEPIAVIDSQLEFVPDRKFRLRIFYDPRTGQELTIDGKYFDLLDNPEVCTFYTNSTMSMLWVVCGDETIAVIAPYKVKEGQLSHVSFNVEVPL